MNVVKGIRVLVLEDEADTRELLGIVLESHGIVAILTSNVPEALETVKKETPDIIVADIGLPDYNGYAFLAALRKEKSDIRNTPVIALTAYTSPADRDTALISGFDEYLTKPFEAAALMATIGRLHEQRLHGEHHIDSAA
jgi:CheY-like chemotaxis protein